jgi:hypothetical protein
MGEKSRYWFMTAHIENMKKAGLSDEQINDPQYVANFFLERWKSSADSRTGCITVCIGANGTYHLHGALYGESTTLQSVSKIMFDSHIELCRGGKTKLMKYILKEDEYAEKGEQVLCEAGRENIRVNRGHRSDLEEIEFMIVQGYTPREIMNEKFSYRRYEKQIKSAYADKKLKEAPLRKQMYVEWHVGESGTGKSYFYEELCKNHDADDIYFAGYMTIGWLDTYMEAGAPSILFMDELKPIGSWQELLNVLDVYTRRAIHCRYMDIYPLWTQVYITSIYPPEKIYEQMVKVENRSNDSLKQLLRRLDIIVYHYIENGVYKQYRMPAYAYTNYENLMNNAKNNVIFVKSVVED